MPHPAFRGTLKVIPYKHEGKDVFIVVDQQEQLFDHQIQLPPLAFVVASLLDGRRETADIRAEIQAQLKVDLKPEEIESVVHDLDQYLLLESGAVQERRRQIADDFAKLSSRPAQFVDGKAEDVSRQLEGYYAADGGAGTIASRRDLPLAGILAPHIDFNRGGPCYTFAYKELAERSDADLYVILGVAHVSPPNPFILTAKSYETPFGPVSADREALAAIEKRIGRRIYDHEAVHRSEHSIEFQTVFLKHARPKAPFTVLPILCSAFEMWCGAASPSTASEVEEVLGAIREATAGRNVCIVAGVDFAHVGPVFGDDVAIDQKLIDWMMAGDTRGLQVIAEGNAESFWNSVVSDGNRRHVCGLSATYAALRLLDPVEGSVHKYGFAPDPAGGLVSFASVSFKPKSRILRP
ncbi:MAG TPA: AmmeMemoRadiSam system protein B [Planctomycetota bacterium]|nr:AmmeMemoRadiSam system protein B [Planctomycetota bacterium]